MRAATGMRILIVRGDLPFTQGQGRPRDEVAGLAQGLAARGHDVAVAFAAIADGAAEGAAAEAEGEAVSIPVQLGGVSGSVRRTRRKLDGVVYLEVELPCRAPDSEPGKNGPVDECARTVFFCRAIAEAAGVLGLQPQVIHAFGWRAGLLPALVEIERRERPGFAHTATVFSMDGMEEQGLFPGEAFAATGLDRTYFNWRQMEFYGQLNLLKTGIVFAHAIATLHAGDAARFRTPELGHGLEGVLAERAADLAALWLYSDEGSETGGVSRSGWRSEKRECKRRVQEEFGLPARADIPLLCIASRLVRQKGIDLFCEAAERLMDGSLQVVIMGTGSPDIERAVVEVAGRYPDQVAVRLGFGPPEQILTGADMCLVPSRSLALRA